MKVKVWRRPCFTEDVGRDHRGGQNKKRDPKETAVLDIDIIKFTPRDQQVLDLLVQGRSNKEIAGQLSISSRPVKQHLRTLFLRAVIREGRKRVRLATAAFEKATVARIGWSRVLAEPREVARRSLLWEKIYAAKDCRGSSSWRTAAKRLHSSAPELFPNCSNSKNKKELSTSWSRPLKCITGPHPSGSARGEPAPRSWRLAWIIKRLFGWLAIRPNNCGRSTAHFTPVLRPKRKREDWDSAICCATSPCSMKSKRSRKFAAYSWNCRARLSRKFCQSACTPVVPPAALPPPTTRHGRRKCGRTSTSSNTPVTGCAFSNTRGGRA